MTLFSETIATPFHANFTNINRGSYKNEISLQISVYRLYLVRLFFKVFPSYYEIIAFCYHSIL
jgi:hypothetical protein